MYGDLSVHNFARLCFLIGLPPILYWFCLLKKNKKAWKGKGEDSLKLMKKDNLSQTYPHKNIFMHTLVYLLWKYHEGNKVSKGGKEPSAEYF